MCASFRRVRRHDGAQVNVPRPSRRSPDWGKCHMIYDDASEGPHYSPLPRTPDATGHFPPARDPTTTPEFRRTLPSPRARTKPPTRLVRVLLCEDQEVFRLGLRVVLEAEPDMAVVAEPAHLSEALALAERMGTQVVVVRQGLVGEASLPVLRDLCARGTAVLVLAEPGCDAETELVDVLQAGVRGYLPRRSAAQQLVEGVGARARHEAALDTAATDQLVRYVTEPPGPGGSGRVLEQLTERQREVAELVSQGL